MIEGEAQYMKLEKQVTELQTVKPGKIKRSSAHRGSGLDAV